MFLSACRSRIVAGLAAALSLCVAPVAQAETFIFTGTGNGVVDVFETAQSGRQFYNSVRRSTTLVPASGVNLFFHRDTRNDTLSVLLLVDRFNDGTSGSLSGSFSNLTPSATVTRSDDNGELQLTSPGVAVFNFTFNNRGIDGGVISGLNPLDVGFQFNITSAAGLSSVNLVGTTGFTTIGAPSAGFSLVANNPEPEAWALFIISFFGVAIAMKRQRKTIITSSLENRAALITVS